MVPKKVTFTHDKIQGDTLTGICARVCEDNTQRQTHGRRRDCWLTGCLADSWHHSDVLGSLTRACFDWWASVAFTLTWFMTNVTQGGKEQESSADFPWVKVRDAWGPTTCWWTAEPDAASWVLRSTRACCFNFIRTVWSGTKTKYNI